MKTIILILIPCICLGLVVPSSGDCGRVQRQPMETGESYPPCVCSTHTSPYYGGQAIQVQAIDPRYLQGMTREQLVWFVIIGLAVSIWCLETNG